MDTSFLDKVGKIARQPQELPPPLTEKTPLPPKDQWRFPSRLRLGKFTLLDRVKKSWRGGGLDLMFFHGRLGILLQKTLASGKALLKHFNDL